MYTFIARQPVLDKNNKIFGFELLFRENNTHIYNISDGDEATLEVIRNSYFNIGMNKIAGNKIAFIKITANLLKSDIFDLIPKESVAIEILKNIEPDKDIIDACTMLKQNGFIIVLDSFIYHEKYRELIQLADIIKIDFSVTKGIERKNVVRKINLKNVKFLAEQISTIAEFDQAIEYGYSLFQGDYFSKPVIISSKKIPESKMIYLNLLRELSCTELNFDTIENLVRRDISMAFKILKIINSAYFGFQNNIKSLRQAITLLGEKEIRSWMYFFIMKNISSNKPDILLQNSLIRAKFCELMLFDSSTAKLYDNAYLMGMLSLIDVILDRPMNEILNELRMPEEVEAALLGSENSSLRNILSMVIAYEEGNWEEVSLYLKKLKFSERVVSKAYLESCEWVDKRMS